MTLIAALLLAAANPSTLFASDEPVHLVLRAPFKQIAAEADRNMDAHSGTIEWVGHGGAVPARLSARGMFRRTSGSCAFPPIRLDIAKGAGVGTGLEGLRHLKLATHCKPDARFEQHVLLEYSAYRIYNLLSPLSFRARLATVDYYEGEMATVPSTHLGFLVEPPESLARRNGLKQSRSSTTIPVSTLDPMQAARAALFEYMIANLDWAMQANGNGEPCCHNFRLLADPAKPGVNLPVPYDFDMSGLDNRPYAEPPPQFELSGVRQRYFHGFCIHRAYLPMAAAEFRAKRSAIDALYSTIPGMTDGTRADALKFLAGFWKDIASDAGVDRLSKNCSALH